MTFEEEFQATLNHMDEAVERLNLCVMALHRLVKRIREEHENPPKEDA